MFIYTQKSLPSFTQLSDHLFVMVSNLLNYQTTSWCDNKTNHVILIGLVVGEWGCIHWAEQCCSGLNLFATIASRSSSVVHSLDRILHRSNLQLEKKGSWAMPEVSFFTFTTLYTMVTTQRMQLRPLWVHPHGPIEQSWLGRTILVTRSCLMTPSPWTTICTRP